MRRLLFILAVLTGICIAFSDELRNKTALTIKTSNPFSNSIICGNIDSVTFSKTALDGSVHDSVVTKMIHTPDSVFTYALDSIQSVTLDDVSEYKEINEFYIDLNSFIESIASGEYDANSLLSLIMKWIEKRNDVISADIIADNYGVLVKHINGLTPIILISEVEEESNPDAITKVVFTESKPSKRILCRNVKSKPEEEIMYNNHILYFRGKSAEWWETPADFWDFSVLAADGVLEKSPVDAKIYRNNNYGDLNFLVRELPKADVAIISATHGIAGFNGGFKIEYTDVLHNEIIIPMFEVQLKGKAIILSKNKKFYALHPKFFESYSTGMGVGILNYCWSNELVLYLDKLKSENKRFSGYMKKTDVFSNAVRFSDYLSYLLDGYTHVESIRKMQLTEYDDEQNFSVNLFKSGQEKRFFSIENLGTTVDPLKDCCWIKYKIKGWKNLKKDINKLKIWYKGESFEVPDEQCYTIEYDLKRMFYSGCNIGPCTLGEGDRISFNNEGPDFFVYLRLNGIEADTLYYTLGFEHDYKNVKSVYHTDVVAVGGITPGVTQGQCIDMGLPSETKWAAWNVGASKPEEYGGSYGWGEPTGTYTEVPYSSPVAGGYDNYAEVVSHYGGESPASDISGSKYDIAHVKWGDGWCLPSVEQWNELMNDEYTLWQHYSLFGVSGIRIISKINGNKLFLPVEFGSLSSGVGSSKFWTGELDENSDNKYSAKTAYVSRYFDSDISKKAGNSERRWSLIHVRPVKKSPVLNSRK